MVMMIWRHFSEIKYLDNVRLNYQSEKGNIQNIGAIALIQSIRKDLDLQSVIKMIGHTHPQGRKKERRQSNNKHKRQ